MTVTRFTYSVFARPKNKDVDEIMDKVNESMSDFGFDEKIHYTAEIGTFAFNLEDDSKQEKNKKKVLDMAKEVMEQKYLSDVILKFKRKEPAHEGHKPKDS